MVGDLPRNKLEAKNRLVSGEKNKALPFCYIPHKVATFGILART